MQSQHELLIEFYYISDTTRCRGLLGKAGDKILDFVQNVDYEHPQTPEVFASMFSDKVFSLQVGELFLLAERYALNNHIIPLLPKLLDKKKLSKSFLKSDAFAIRLLPKEKRELFRVQKKMQVVNLAPVYKKADFWNRCQNEFSAFARFNEPYREEIQAYEKRALTYIDLGLKISGDKTVSDINKLRNNEVYYGFNHINLSHASSILARKHGFKLRTTYDVDDFKSCSIVGYEARAYPLHDMIYIASKELLKLVHDLDNFPEANGKAIFDNFIVLVPSSGYTGVENSDRMFIEDGYIIPVLLGEKDSKCFFISDWR
jgi:hypothetical protein